jgi:hypothetical protein
MARPAQRRLPSSSDGWAAVGWSVLALLAAGVLGALALPGTTPRPFTAFTSTDFLRAEWLVLATLLAYPIYRAARAHWLAALPVAAIVSAENWYVVDTGLDALHTLELAAPASDAMLDGLVAGQAVLFTAVAMVGGWQSIERGRWLRRMRRLMPELADAAAVGAGTTAAEHKG